MLPSHDSRLSGSWLRQNRTNFSFSCGGDPLGCRRRPVARLTAVPERAADQGGDIARRPLSRSESLFLSEAWAILRETAKCRAAGIRGGRQRDTSVLRHVKSERDTLSITAISSARLTKRASNMELTVDMTKKVEFPIEIGQKRIYRKRSLWPYRLGRFALRQAEQGGQGPAMPEAGRMPRLYLNRNKWRYNSNNTSAYCTRLRCEWERDKN